MPAEGQTRIYARKGVLRVPVRMRTRESVPEIPMTESGSADYAIVPFVPLFLRPPPVVDNGVRSLARQHFSDHSLQVVFDRRTSAMVGTEQLRNSEFALWSPGCPFCRKHRALAGAIMSAGYSHYWSADGLVAFRISLC